MSLQSTQSSDKMIKKGQGHQGKKDDDIAQMPLDLSTIIEISGPKKAMSGYNLFVQERMPLLIKENGGNEEKQKYQEYMKVLAAMWNALGELQEKYVQLAQNDKERFKNQSEEFEEKGFFTMADGK